MENKKYCVSFRTSHTEKLVDGFKGWYIELTDNFTGYNLTSDEYGFCQVHDTLQEAINSVRELRTNEAPYVAIGF